MGRKPGGSSPLQQRLVTSRFWAGVTNLQNPLPVYAGDEHRPPVHFTAWLVGGNNWGFISLWGHIADSLAETAAAEAIGAAEEIDGVVRAVRRDARLHSAVVLVA